MDCCLCDQSLHLFRPRNSICISCYEAAKDILEITSRLDLQEEMETDDSSTEVAQSDQLKMSFPKKFNHSGQGQGLGGAVKQIKQLEQMMCTAANKISYLGAIGEAFTQGYHADLELITDDNVSLRVHKVIMATRSSVFRAMLEKDIYKDDKVSRIHVADIGAMELRHLVEFMYTGQLTMDALQDHIAGLMLAADKYDMPLLIEICEAYLIDTMSTRSALDVLEVATRLSSATTLEEVAMSTIVHNSETILFSKEYEEFAVKNPLLAVKISQSVMKQLTLRATLKSPRNQ
ncbi:hypothetical protein KP509_27G030400 [Ceratopteris richardii]|uniref:BTB domain-containing protein n=1 Tax=Ceratopteris richardii TaxID=49495 RepID=A0A8T2REZ0_CERRI|nr:hypothetical protein KP509_27G030400 [Ceratopteris richardii]